MAIAFKQKLKPNLPRPEALKLAEFILIKSLYLGPTFFILSRKTTPISLQKDVEDRIKGHIGFRIFSKDADYNKFVNLLFRFYNTTDKALERRRADLLEVLIRQAYPTANKSLFTMISECNVFDNGIKISDKDIDVVFNGPFIEAIECKASLAAYLHPVPLPKKKKEKLAFMEQLKNIAGNYSIKCDLYLATYGDEQELYEDILERSKFKCITVLRKTDIANRLIS